MFGFSPVGAPRSMQARSWFIHFRMLVLYSIRTFLALGSVFSGHFVVVVVRNEVVDVVGVERDGIQDQKSSTQFGRVGLWVIFD